MVLRLVGLTIVMETMAAVAVTLPSVQGRFALCHDEDIATDDALCLGRPVWHAPGELKRDSSSMLLGASLLRGSHCGSNRTGDNCSDSERHALPHDDDDTTDDALRSGRPVWHAPGELT
jgi:hypothetical protein